MTLAGRVTGFRDSFTGDPSAFMPSGSDSGPLTIAPNSGCSPSEKEGVGPILSSGVFCVGLSSGPASGGGCMLGFELWALSSDMRLETSFELSNLVSTTGRGCAERFRLCIVDCRVRTAFIDSRTSRPLFGMGEFCTGGSAMPLVPRCFCIWYCEKRRDARRSSSPPLCNAASASSCFGGGGGGGKSTA